MYGPFLFPTTVVARPTRVRVADVQLCEDVVVLATDRGQERWGTSLTP